MRAHNPPDTDQDHGPPVHNTRPVHHVGAEIGAGHAGEAQNGHHQSDEGGGDGTGGDGVTTEVPGAGAEALADEEDADEDGDCEGTKRRCQQRDRL